MRKVYDARDNALGVPLAVGMSAAITALIFCIIPFSHIVNKPDHTLELRKAGAVDLPPPAEEQTPPPTFESDKPPPAPPQPELSETPQQIPLSADLEVAVGAGGALAGFGEVQALTAPQAIQNETFDVSELEKRPEPVTQVPPVYPSELRKAKIEGLVTLVFVLNEDGHVEEPRVETSSRPEFEKPALDAIHKWRFRPGMREGKPVRTYIRLPIRFRVSNG